MSRIIAVCPHCQRKYKVDVQLVGRTTECKQCKTGFQIVAEEDPDSFELPDAKEYLADQPFDPLAPAFEGDDDPAQTYDIANDAPGQPAATPVQVRNWKKEIKQSRLNAPFGPNQQALLGLGGLLVVAGVVINLLHLFGVQLGDGNTGRFVGLVVGLIGAGAVAASLLKFPAAARIAGAATAIFVFVVFLASIINAQKKQKPVVEVVKPEEVNTIAEFDSPWIAEFPNWIGFDEMKRMPSVADRWNRHQLGSTEFSASFPGQPTTASERIRVSRTNIIAGKLEATVNDFEFSLMAFEFPNPRGKTDKKMLSESELAFGDIEFGKNIEFDRCAGREYKITSSALSTHGRIFLVDNQIVHIKVTGTSTMVPGVLSREFLESLQVRSNGPLVEEKLPELQLADEQTQRNEAISANHRKIDELISVHIRTGGLMNFPSTYLSISAGRDAGNRSFLVHPGKLPIVGVDLIEAQTPSGEIICNISPIFGEATDDQSIMANEGYALAGMEVNAGSWVKGVRLEFMKVTPVGFDTSTAYRSPWYGTRSSGVPEKLGGDGRPVYGFWMCRTRMVKSIGLIRESN